MSEQQAPADVAVNAPVQTEAQPQSWYSGIQDESLRGFAELKGWKDPAAVVDSYRNLEKLRGVPENELLRLPKEGDADAWNAFYQRLGRPESADKYNLPVPEGDDGEFAKTASAWMHEAGLTQQQAEILAAKNNEWAQQQQQVYQEQLAARQEQEMNELKAEWGMAFDQNAEIARRGAQQFGLDAEMLGKLEDALGTKQLLTMFHNIGSKVGEHRAEGFGKGDGFKLSPSAAQERINQLKQDKEWSAKYLAGGANEKAELQRLMQMAYPG